MEREERNETLTARKKTISEMPEGTVIELLNAAVELAGTHDLSCMCRLCRASSDYLQKLKGPWSPPEHRDPVEWETCDKDDAEEFKCIFKRCSCQKTIDWIEWLPAEVEIMFEGSAHEHRRRKKSKEQTR